MARRNPIEWLQELVWPSRCAACHERAVRSEGPDGGFCAVCAESLVPMASPVCPRCGIGFDGRGPDHPCIECSLTPPPFQRATAEYRYGGAVKDALLRLKYGRVPWIAVSLGDAAGRAAAGLSTPDVVVPVPLFPRRLRERGFNQSALLARRVAHRIGRPMRTDLLVRIRETVPQAGLDRAARESNVKGAFAVRRPGAAAGLRVLLVDDVITTGTTVREAATVLCAAGAATVDVAAAARAY